MGYYVYALSLDGVNHTYVGQTTTSIEQRLDKHLKSRARSQPLYWWIRHHYDKLGKTIQVTLLQECTTRDELNAAEYDWIHRLREQGFVLLNQQHGARFSNLPKYDGNPWDNSEYRERMTSIMQSNEYRQKMSKALKGKSKPCASSRVSCVRCRKETNCTGLVLHLRRSSCGSVHTEPAMV